MMKYIVAVLVALVIAFGGSTYVLNDKLAASGAENMKLVELVEKADNELVLSKASCKITETVIGEQHQEEKALNRAQEKAVETLRGLPTTIVKEKPQNAPMEKNGALPQTSGGFADDARVSPDVKRLLDQAYCYGKPDDSACTTN